MTAPPCPTCSFPSRQTVGMVCRTCLTDYAPGPTRWAEGYEAGRAEVTAAAEALADEWACDCDPGPDGHPHREWCRSYFAQRLRAVLAVLAAAPTLATVRADAARDALNAAADWMEAHFTHGSGWTGERVAYLLRARAEAVGDDHA